MDGVADAPVSRCDLPRRPTVHIHKEQMPEAALGEAYAVAPEVQPLRVARSGGPFGTFGCLGKIDLPLLRARHDHRETDSLAIGRPVKVAGILGHRGELRGRARYVEMQHEDLLALRLPLSDVRDDLAVG